MMIIEYTDKDVARTDRDVPFFANDDNPNLVLLRDVLLTHTELDAELGLHIIAQLRRFILPWLHSLLLDTVSL